MNRLQPPRVVSLPASSSSIADEALDFCRANGLELDPWQEFVFSHALAKRDGGKWAAFEVGVNVPRQNGKGTILEARELVGLFLLDDERLIVHSAHEFATSLEAFRRLLWLLEEAPDLEAQIKRVSRAHGEEGFELKNGSRIRFRTRTRGGGRGFTADCLILDEAMFLPEFAHGALLPIISARPNPQVWYTGSAVDQQIHEHGVVFTRVRERAIAGDDPALAYFEWSVGCESPDKLEHDTALDEEEWRKANPALGIRIPAEHVAFEERSMDGRTFAVERLGVGDYPPTDGRANTVIDYDLWKSLLDADSEPQGYGFAFDVSPDRAYGSISKVGRRTDGLMHIELFDRRAGTEWMVPRLEELERELVSLGIVCDERGPAGSLVPELRQRNVDVKALNTTEHAQAWGMFMDEIARKTIRHLGQEELDSAVKGAGTRPLGDAFAWSRKGSTTDITPLVSSTLGVWLVTTEEAKQPLFAFG